MASTHQGYLSLVADIQAYRFAPVYLLCGEETYYTDALVSLLQSHVIAEDEKDFNFTQFYGIDAEVEDISNLARQYPVMAQRRLIMFKETQTLHNAKINLEKLIPYIERPTSTTVLVITYKGDSFSAASKLVKAIQKGKGIVFNSPKLYENQLDDVIKELCLSRKVEIEDKSIAMLKERIGVNLAKISTALDKIILTLPESIRIITPELIEQNIGVSKDFNNFELVKAIAFKDYVKAVRIINYFEKNPKGNPSIVTGSVLFKFFSDILLAHYSKDKSPAGIAASIKVRSVNSPVFKDVVAAMQFYNASKCVKIIRAIRDFDCMSKGIGSLQKDYLLLRDLLFRIFTI